MTRRTNPRRIGPRSATLLFVAVVLVSAGGATCHRRDYNAYTTYGPRVLTQTPSTQDVVQAVNANSAKIRSLFTKKATLTVPGAPSLNANMALERPKRLRLRAETGITGAELDVGSNDELFWLWIKRNPPPTIYYCRHEQFASSQAKQFVPIDPDWLLDAVGLASFNPSLQHSMPERTANGRWQIRTAVPTQQGMMTKLTVVDDARAWVLEQHLYDERNTLVASALTSRHTLDAASGAVVPQEIEVIWPATQFRLKFDVQEWIVNSIPADPLQLFSMPSVPGWNVVDLGDPNLRMTLPNAQGIPTATPGLNTPVPGAMPTYGTPGNGTPEYGVPVNGGASGYGVPTSSVPGGGTTIPSPMGPMFAAPGSAAARRY